MNPTREELAAFADGQLEAERAAEVAAVIAADPVLAAQVEAHRALKARLSAHFAPILDEPLPERLSAPLAARAEVVDFAAAKSTREERRKLPRWSWIAAPAIAASLALALFAPRAGDREGYASGQLATALDSQLVATQSGDAPTRILLSFRDRAGAYCRAFAGQASSGIACRDAQGWKLVRREAAGAAPSGEYRQAGNSETAVLEAAQALTTGPALDAAQESAAQARGWR
jgi:hypothetical protein